METRYLPLLPEFWCHLVVKLVKSSWDLDAEIRALQQGLSLSMDVVYLCGWMAWDGWDLRGVLAHIFPGLHLEK